MQRRIDRFRDRGHRGKCGNTRCLGKPILEGLLHESRHLMSISVIVHSQVVERPATDRAADRATGVQAPKAIRVPFTACQSSTLQQN